MTTNEIKLKPIAEDLEKQVNLCEEALKETAYTMGLLKNTPEQYNEAWNGYAVTSIMHHQFLLLKNFVDSEDVKMAENCIRFTIYQIEQSTNHDDLIKDEATGDLLLDSKITIFQIFKTYLKQLED